MIKMLFKIAMEKYNEFMWWLFDKYPTLYYKSYNRGVKKFKKDYKKFGNEDL